MNDDAPSGTPAPDQPEAAQAATESPPAQTTAPWRAKLRKWLVISAVGVIVLPMLTFGVWSWIALSWAYSSGDRAGYIQKFSKKGWLCPTWEGELSMVNLPGAAPERWLFTVRDDVIANAVRSSMGHKVALEYEEHPGVPTSCFGETRYFVIGVRRLAEP